MFFPAMKKVFHILSVSVFLFSCSGTKKSGTGESKQPEPELKKVIVDRERHPPDQPAATYHIQSFSITGDILNIKVGFTGGCGKHNFQLFGNGMLKKSLPPQLDVYLEHNIENETCKKEMTQNLRFDLSPLKKSGNPLIVVNINSADNKAEWKIQ